MSFLTLWLLVLILDRSIASKHRNVNLALETVLQFDKAEDINVINKLQGFLSHIQLLLDKNQQISSNVTTRRKNKYLFTDFVEDLITTINRFHDNDLKQVIRIIDKDFRTRKLDNDLIDDNVRRFVYHKLTEIRNQPAINIRRDLDRILRELRAHKIKKSSYIIDFLNTLYKRQSEKKLLKLIKRLNLFPKSARKSKIVLKSIIEKVVHDVIYENYNNLKDIEKVHIKNFVKAYVIDNIPTNKLQKIKQRAKDTDIGQEITNTNENIDESKLTNQVTLSQLTSKTFKNVPIGTTKKIFTHITLYPKTIKVKKIPTGFRAVKFIKSTLTNEENTKNKRNEEKTTELNEIFSNQSVEINVNLMLKHGQDSQNREDSQMAELVRTESTTKNIFLRSFKKSIKNKSYHKSSSPGLSIETFGSLYRKKTPKRYNNKKISKPVIYNDKTKIEDRHLKSTYADDRVKEEGVLKKMHFVGDRRRFNKPTNLNEDKVPESAIKDTVRTTQHTLSTRAFVSLIIPSDKLTTPVVTTDKNTKKSTQTTKKSTQATKKSTQNIIRNEILNNENVTNFKEGTKKPLFKKIRTNKHFVPLNKTTQFEDDLNNNIKIKTTVTEVSMIPFDVNNFIKNSKVLNFGNDEKMKQIQERMKADFENFIEPQTNATTTEGFTDIFKELEDAFEITS